MGVSVLSTLLGLSRQFFWYVALPLGGFNVLAILTVLGCHAWCHLRIRNYHGFVTVMRIDNHIMATAGVATVCEVYPVEELPDFLLTDLGFVLSREEFLQVLTFHR